MSYYFSSNTTIAKVDLISFTPSIPGVLYGQERPTNNRIRFEIPYPGEYSLYINYLKGTSPPPFTPITPFSYLQPTTWLLVNWCIKPIGQNNEVIWNKESWICGEVTRYSEGVIRLNLESGPYELSLLCGSYETSRLLGAEEDYERYQHFCRGAYATLTAPTPTKNPYLRGTQYYSS